MEEYIFRAWDKKLKIMHYPKDNYDIDSDFGTECYKIQDMVKEKVSTKNIDDDDLYSGEEWYPISNIEMKDGAIFLQRKYKERLILMPYIGLVDKNDNKIFKDDWVVSSLKAEKNITAIQKEEYTQIFSGYVKFGYYVVK